MHEATLLESLKVLFAQWRYLVFRGGTIFFSPSMTITVEKYLLMWKKNSLFFNNHIING